MPGILPIITRRLSHICSLKPYKETRWLMPNGNPTGLYVYNCVAEEKVPIILKDPRVATWYSCGPTVYDSAHVGHASCYVKLDIIQRILESFFNIKLITAMGITDVDDKIIRKAKNTEKDIKTVSQQYEHEFWLDMASLNVAKPMIICRVSDHIDTITSFIQNLVDTGKAYITKDGSVYFDTGKFPAYGKLLKMHEPDEPSNSEKRNAMDFALWKGHKPDEPYWEAPWGKGRPGWHIECSAMVSKVFGPQLDFHAGGIDLRFPHHENEEAQSCAFHEIRQWANYWVHVGHLHVEGDVKMSKSLKNTISIPTLLKSYSADTFRMACLMSNYKYPMEFNDKVMQTAGEVLNKFKFFLQDTFVYLSRNATQNVKHEDILLEDLQRIEDDNFSALRNDFDTASCINSLLGLISSTNKIIKADSSEYYPIPVILVAKYITSILTQFGLTIKETDKNKDVGNTMIDMLVDFRHNVRRHALGGKDLELLKQCDVVRDKMKSMNIQINDSNKAASWVQTK